MAVCRFWVCIVYVLSWGKEGRGVLEFFLQNSQFIAKIAAIEPNVEVTTSS